MSLRDMPGLLMQVLMAQENGPVVRGLQQGRGAPHVPAQGLAPHTPPTSAVSGGGGKQQRASEQPRCGRQQR